MSDEKFDLAAKTILIVDDNPTNLGVLADYLEERGLTILVARDGESGLAKAAYALPDLILLDVMMPGIDGFEACRRLKANPETAVIPVIFMTALTSIEDKVKGFEAGAVDYVTKPLYQEEVLARVTTHLKMVGLTRRLQKTNAQLQKANADKDKFFSIIAHDLRGAFLPLLLNTELLARQASHLSEADIEEMSASTHHSALLVSELLENLLQWGRLQMGRLEYRPQRLDLARLAENNFLLIRQTAEKKEVQLKNEVTEPTPVFGDRHMLDTVLRNLLSNAVKFTGVGGVVRLTAQERVGFVEVRVRDTGVGIREEDMAKLFDLGVNFTTMGTAQEKGSGLGLVMCREMIARHGGEFSIESEAGVGTTICFTAPGAAEAA